MVGSALRGALAGVMIREYYLVRKTRLHLPDLYKLDGRYPRWGRAA